MTDDAGLQLGDFDRVDATGDPRGYVEWMDRQRSAHRDRSLDQLGIGPTDVVLDLGCGTGVDLHRVASIARLAVGLDRSQTMAGAARSRAPDAAVIVGDAQRIPIGDAVVDACSSRAVLVHTPDPQAAVCEIVRVLKPGGRMMLSEPDQGSHIVATAVPDVFDRIKRHRQTKFRHPLIGRSLAGLATAAGAAVAKTWVTPILHTSLSSASGAGGPFDRAIADAVTDGAVTEREANDYRASLVDADERGCFFFAALAVTVVAAKPPQP